MKKTKLCFDCRMKNGWVAKDNGAHTGCRGKCEECGEVKPIKPERHYRKDEKTK